MWLNIFYLNRKINHEENTLIRKNKNTKMHKRTIIFIKDIDPNSTET